MRERLRIPDPASAPRQSRLSICLFGAAGDTQNLGVSALQEATVQGLAKRLPYAQVTVFDHGRGMRRASLGDPAAPIPIDLRGARSSRRIHQPESWPRIRAALRLPATRNPSAVAIRSADAILDISGGDSFSDIYGRARFRTVAAPKRAALSSRIPLVLLPQTYGPFHAATVRGQAAELLRGAAFAWARDLDSFERMRTLLGAAFDPRRHRCGVDVAFALEPRAPHGGWPSPLRSWLAADRDRPVVGLNVSGLVFFSPDPAGQFGIGLDYPELSRRLLHRLLERTDARVLLIPHVLGRGGTESDEAAADRLREAAGEHADRVALAPSAGTAAQAKALIARLDWFCGTRMHACIAALSSAVPTAGVAYSLKTRGVFESVGQGSAVIDARVGTTDEALEALWASWESRDGARRDLAVSLPVVRDAAERQMDEIAAALAELAHGSDDS